MCIEKMNVCEAHPCCCFSLLLMNEKNVTAAKNLCKKEKVFEDDVFTENTCLGSVSKRRTKFTRGRSFTQVTWFSWPMVTRDWICVRPPSLLWEQVALPPKLNYRSVKSYNITEFTVLVKCFKKSKITEEMDGTKNSQDNIMVEYNGGVHK